MEYLVYLDLCCFNRPFDEQRQERIRLESEAVLLILQRCQQGDWQLMGSEAVIAEISQTQDLDRQARLRSLVDLATRFVQVDEAIEMRSAELIQQGFMAFDALHLACAESGGADVFLTTDDRLQRRAARLVDVLQVRVENPVMWLLEVTADADE